MNDPTTRSLPARAFAALELLAVFVIIALVVSLLAVAADRSRRNARLGHDTANLRQIGAATGAYAADFDGLLWSFSWQGSPEEPSHYSKYGDLNGDITDYTAQASQAVDALKRLAGREDIPKINQWFANYRYSHLVLQEYLHQPMPHRMWISSGDANRLMWANDPSGFDQGKFGKQQPPKSSVNKRWPYSSSYIMPAGNFDESPVGDRSSQASTHNTFLLPSNGDLRPRPFSLVAFPAGKVLIHDSWTWHFGPRQAFFGHEQAHVVTLFADGAAGARSTLEANQGWWPNTPTSANCSVFDYLPSTWEPPTMAGTAEETVKGYFYWTRDGLYGRDFGGPEVCTGQPDCGK